MFRVTTIGWFVDWSFTFVPIRVTSLNERSLSTKLAVLTRNEDTPRQGARGAIL